MTPENMVIGLVFIFLIAVYVYCAVTNQWSKRPPTRYTSTRDFFHPEDEDD